MNVNLLCLVINLSEVFDNVIKSCIEVKFVLFWKFSFDKLSLWIYFRHIYNDSLKFEN